MGYHIYIELADPAKFISPNNSQLMLRFHLI